MRAIVCRDWGPPEALELAELPQPRPAAGQVLVSVRAAGVNFPDALIVQGKHQIKPPLPFIPGVEVAGVVKEIGSAVDVASGIAVGARVYGAQLRGSFAEEVAVEAVKLRPIPAALGFEEAACAPVAGHTAWYSLVELGRLRAGECVLVLGAAGGVGLAAVEVAVALGARVIAAASSDEKLAACREHGADALIQYEREDLRARIAELTHGRGIDIVYDPVGGRFAQPALRGLAWGGRYLVVGFASGTIPSVPLNLPLLKGGSVMGVFLGRALELDPALQRWVIDGFDALLSTGRIRPRICGRYELERAPQALRELLERRAVGKLVVIP
jgi:NADPH2:quinone reductase